MLPLSPYRCFQFYLYNNPCPTLPCLLHEYTVFLQWIVYDDYIVGFARFRLGAKPSSRIFKGHTPVWFQCTPSQWVEITNQYTGDRIHTYGYLRNDSEDNTLLIDADIDETLK